MGGGQRGQGCKGLVHTSLLPKTTHNLSPMCKIGRRLRRLLVAAVGVNAASHSEGPSPMPRSAHNLPLVRKSSRRLRRLPMAAVGANAASLGKGLVCNQPLTKKCA